MLALPGVAYLYQGEELGLDEVVDLPDELRQDPAFRRTGESRDGCRVPLPWSGDAAPFGFGPGGAWLPAPATWSAHTVAAQDGEPGSTLSLYRAALRLRRAESALRDEELTWVEAEPGVLAFRRGDLTCVVNLGGEPVNVRRYGTPIVTSAALDGDFLPVDAGAWLKPMPPG
jgi:alpha-glucosidase